jgi:hypothetical protein
MEIYLTTNLINGKIYIGQTRTNDPNYLGSGTLIVKAIQKYGRENFKKETLEIVNKEEQLDEREIFWISTFRNSGYNMYNVQEGGRGWSKTVLDEYWKEFNSKEYERILNILNEIDINFMYNPTKGYVPNPVTVTESLDISIDPRVKKNVYKFDKQGNLLKVYNSIEEAFKSHPMIKSKGNLSSACKGKRSFWGGYRWSYNEYPYPIDFINKGRPRGSLDSNKRTVTHKVYTTYLVEQYNIHNELIKIWSTPQEASDYLQISKQCLMRACKNNSYYKGFLWKKGKKNIITSK